MMSMQRDSKEWKKAREALWEGGVKDELLKDFRKKELKVLKDVFMGVEYPALNFMMDASDYATTCLYGEHDKHYGFFLWPEQNAEYWVEYFEKNVKVLHDGYRSNSRNFIGFHVDPRLFGWDEQTEREWTLFSFADVLYGRVPEASAPRIPSTYTPVEMFERWAVRVSEYIFGRFVPYYGVDFSTVPHDDRAVISTRWVMALIADFPRIFFDESPSREDFKNTGDQSDLVEQGRIYLRRLVWFCHFWETGFNSEITNRGLVVGVDCLPFPSGDDYARKRAVIDDIRKALEAHPASAELLRRALQPGWSVV